jgi:penicillin-binding protein 1A
MARLELRQRFGPSAESAGYKVYTTIDGSLQGDANRAVRVGLIEYDRRHGWRGPAGHVELPAHGEPDYDDVVDEYAAIGNLRLRGRGGGGQECACVREGLRSGGDRLGRPLLGAQGLARRERPGSQECRADPEPRRRDLVADDGAMRSSAIPRRQRAGRARPNDGGIVALVGGFDYFTNKYNRVTGAAPA